jgi:aspartate/methionine/tyrosine aminotransferase
VFSSRLPGRLTPNALSEAVLVAKRRGAALLDLTETNPTKCGLSPPAEALSSLSDARGAAYDPDPRGLRDARDAIAHDCGSRGVPADADRLLLAASTSDAYSLLFKLLCNPGEAVLAPQPSYPLVETLARLDGVEALPYRLEYQGTWSIDRASLVAALDDRARAIVVVTPNNPTGSRLRAADREWLACLAADRELALISDEVFADYVLQPRADAASLSGEARAPTFVLGGLSKSAGLPQVKLAWIAASGPDGLIAAALDRLDVIADMYLSVSTPVQWAARSLLAAGTSARAAILARLAANLTTLRAESARHPAVTLLEPEGGWSAVLRVPATRPEEALVTALVRDALVIVHPGYFFDFPSEAFLVVSLLPEPGVFAEGVRRVMTHVS